MPCFDQQQCLEGSFGSCGYIYSRHGLYSLPYLRLGKSIVYQQPVGFIGRPTIMSSFISVQEVLYISASLLSNKQESELDRKYLIIPCPLSDHDLRIDTYTLINCGCTGLSFMNNELTYLYNFPHYQLKTPKTIKVIDR
jgi:hypothetical protein